MQEERDAIHARASFVARIVDKMAVLADAVWEVQWEEDMRAILATAFVGTSVLVASAGFGMAETWDMATPYPEGNFHTKNIRWFVDEVEKATGGELTINVHSGASMYEMSQIKRALRTGQIPMAEFFLSAYGNEDPVYEADSVPFMAVGQDEAKKLYDLQKPMLDERFEKEGLMALYSVPWPGNGIYTKNSVEDVSDFQGQRIRGQTAIIARLAELLGGQPVDVQFVEVPQAFQTGVIEAMVTAATTGVDTQAWDYTGWFYDASVVTPRNVVAVNAEAWNGLPQEVRDAVLAVAKKAEERGWDISRQLETDAKATLVENGMEAPDMSPALKAELQDIGQKMIAEWVDEAGEDGAELAKAMGKLDAK